MQEAIQLDLIDAVKANRSRNGLRRATLMTGARGYGMVRKTLFSARSKKGAKKKGKHLIFKFLQISSLYLQISVIIYNHTTTIIFHFIIDGSMTLSSKHRIFQDIFNSKRTNLSETLTNIRTEKVGTHRKDRGC